MNKAKKHLRESLEKGSGKTSSKTKTPRRE